MKLLDLYSGAGGCSVGYSLAGFTEIVGVDNRPQPRYPFTFVQADALEYLARLIETGEVEEYALIHASPPCQGYSDLNTINGRDYPKLIPATRELLIRSGRPYVIENVPGALLNGGMLCGQLFGLKVFRHRYFECNPLVLFPSHQKHNGSTGTHRWPYAPANGYVQVTGNGGNFTLEQASAAMEINWMDKAEIAQAIPPAYTHYIGEQMARLVLR